MEKMGRQTAGKPTKRSEITIKAIIISGSVERRLNRFVICQGFPKERQRKTREMTQTGFFLSWLIAIVRNSIERKM
jgi:hypothetical protein